MYLQQSFTEAMRVCLEATEAALNQPSVALVIEGGHGGWVAVRNTNKPLPDNTQMLGAVHSTDIPQSWYYTHDRQQYLTKAGVNAAWRYWQSKVNDLGFYFNN